MDVPVQHADFQIRRLGVRTAGLWKSAQVLIDGRVAAGQRREYRVPDDSGRERTILLKPSFLDPLPRLQIDAEPLLHVGRPLRWYEWTWMVAPVSPVFAGGAFGVLLGISCVWVNTRIFRSKEATAMKYVLSGLLNVVAVLCYSFVALLRSEVH